MAEVKENDIFLLSTQIVGLLGSHSPQISLSFSLSLRYTQMACLFTWRSA